MKPAGLNAWFSRVRHPAVRVVLLTALLAGIQSAFAVLSARWLGPADRGIYTIGVGVGTFSLLIGSLGVYTGGRVLLSDPDSNFSWADYWPTIGVLTSIQLVVVVLVDLPLWHALASVRSLPNLLWFIAYCVSMTAGSLAREGVHGAGRHLRATISDLLATITQLALALTVHAVHDVSVANLLACGAAGFTLQVVICRVSMRDLIPRAHRGFALGPVWRVIAFSIPGLFLVTGQLLVQKGDRLILGIFATPADVGIYAAGATIADAAWIIPTSLSVFVLRQVAVSHSLEPVVRWRVRILSITVASAVFLGVSASTLIHYLLGEQFASAARIVWILCVGSVLFASQQVDISACNGAGRLDLGAKVTGWGALTLVLLSFVLMPRYHGTGAALASVGAYGCMAVLARRACRRLDQDAATLPHRPD